MPLNSTDEEREAQRGSMTYSKSPSQRVVVPGKELKLTSLSPVLTGPSEPGNPLGRVRVPWAGNVLRFKVSATGTCSTELAWGGKGRRNHEFCAPGASLLLPCLTRSPVVPKLPGSAVPHTTVVTHGEGAFSFIYSFVVLVHPTSVCQCPWVVELCEGLEQNPKGRASMSTEPCITGWAS